MSENKEILNRIRNKIHTSEANQGAAGLAVKAKAADTVKSFGAEYTMALAKGQNENVAVDKNMVNKLTASRSNNLGAMSKFANKQYS